MTKIKWHRFEKMLPVDKCAIMVKDHEGNLCPGIWDKKFQRFFSIPLGKVVKWTYIHILTYPGPEEIPGSFILDTEHMRFANGKKIILDELYDFDDP
jgi:hypothetical protein